MEEKITFACGEVDLVGLFSRGQNDRGVVVTHPHPLYGGDMFNNVVEAIARAYRSRGYATLRFNFRGTGGSSGAYDEGRGEQADVAAALDYLAAAGARRVELAGYSFGAWVCARGAARFAAVNRLVLVAPPVVFLDFGDIGPLAKLGLVVSGSEDELGPPERVQALLPRWNPRARLAVIEDADHFYFGAEADLEAEIVRDL
ncbi:MAG: alpha/beta hydrolase [Desulfosudaceae bacterium]